MKVIWGGGVLLKESLCTIQIELNVQALIYAEYIPYSSIAL